MKDPAKLIFIISQPRSGSTLLQKLVSNNKYVDTVSEPWLLLPFLSVYKQKLVTAKYNYRVAIKGLMDYVSKMKMEAEFRQSMRDFVLKMYRVSDDSQFFLDKTPRYYEIIPEIYELLPEAKFIILKRNPFASLYSLVTTWADGKLNYEKFSTFYRDFLAAPFLLQSFLDANSSRSNVIEVKYEDVVTDPDNYMQKLYAILGIPFEVGVLEIQGNQKVKGIFGDDVYKKGEALSRVTDAKIDLFKSVVTNSELSDFFYHYQNYLTMPFIEKYGYGPEPSFRKKFSFGKSEFNRFLEQTIQKDQ